MFRDPFPGNVVGRMGSTRCEIDKEGFARCYGLLLPDPRYRLISEVLIQDVVWITYVRLDRLRAFIERGLPLVRITADKAVEVFKTKIGRP